ncbi:MAG: DUF501 domain-containing protein [Microbacteriaceae bacterium]|nr:DUF501 domain-containing protein [Microbacteriaceae bacterium]
MSHWEPLRPGDAETIREQLHRAPRGLLGVAARSPDGTPAVVVTDPLLPDGSPFPTFYYLTLPRLIQACSTLEAEGWMAPWAARLEQDPALGVAYTAAHTAYLTDRAAIREVPRIAGISAGGMPVRVKCVHALVAHALAAGPGVNPVGDTALAGMGWPGWEGRGWGAQSPTSAPDAGMTGM